VHFEINILPEPNVVLNVKAASVVYPPEDPPSMQSFVVSTFPLLTKYSAPFDTSSISYIPQLNQNKVNLIKIQLFILLSFYYRMKI